MVRTFALDLYSGVGPFARVIFDAFLEAGGLLVVYGNVVFRFATNFDEVDEMLGIYLSGSDTQQVVNVRECVLERFNNGLERRFFVGN